MGNLKQAGFIIRSGYRRQVFMLLDKPVRPSKIAKRLDIRLTHITRELRALKNRKLVECINPKEKVGRLYRLTRQGKQLKKEMISKNLI